MIKTTTTLALLLSGALATAQFSSYGAGPFNSCSNYGYGFGNGSFTSQYSGPSTIFTNLTLSATLTSNDPSEWAWESMWDIQNHSRGNQMAMRLSEDHEYTSITSSHTISGLFFIHQNDNYRFEAVEYANNTSVVRSIWTDVSITYDNSPMFIDLGLLPRNSPVTLYHELTDLSGGMSLNPVGGLFNSAGDLIGLTGGYGPFNFTNLTPGEYYFSVGDEDSFYENGFAVAGSYDGLLRLELNGSTVYAGQIDAHKVKAFRFGVVPEPASFVVLGIGALVLLRRRARKAG